MSDKYRRRIEEMDVETIENRDRHHVPEPEEEPIGRVRGFVRRKISAHAHVDESRPQRPKHKSVGLPAVQANDGFIPHGEPLFRFRKASGQPARIPWRMRLADDQARLAPFLHDPRGMAVRDPGLFFQVLLLIGGSLAVVAIIVYWILKAMGVV